jgi:hypothetical protein
MNSRQDTLPKKDNEALCAYLDGVMTGEERQKFETRLSKSLRLQKALKEYTQLRLAVRSLPCQPAPRNFTLTREEARAIKRQPVLYPAFSYASLASVLILALLFTSEFIFKTYSAPMAREVPSEPALMTVPSVESTAQAGQPQIFTWGSAYGMGGGGAGGIGVGAPHTAYLPGGGYSMDTTIAEGTAEEPAPPEETLPSEAGGGGLLETPTAETPEAQVFSVETSTEPVEPLIFGVRESEAGQIVSSYPPAQAKSAPETAADSQAEASRALVPDYLKIGLLTAAVVFALAALVFYLKR